MNQTQPVTVQDNVIVTLNYTVSVNGETVDSSEEDEPIEFIQGMGMVVRGLERGLYGMETGEKRQFTVAPAEGYGEMDPDAIAEVPRSEFPDEIPLEPGVELLLKDEDGDEMEAQIAAVGEDSITLNFNHPLAGKFLDFDVEVISLRWATPEELDHGHVH